MSLGRQKHSAIGNTSAYQRGETDGSSLKIKMNLAKKKFVRLIIHQRIHAGIQTKRVLR